VPAPQEPVNPFGVEITSPAGSVSLKVTPVCAVALGLVRVKLRLVEPFSGMLAVPNTLAIVGGPTTVIDAFDVLPVPPSVEVTWTLLFFTPAAVPVTFTEKVQELLAAIVPPFRLIVFVPWVAVIVPAPQEPVNPFGTATTRPAGRLSLNATPVSPIDVFGLVRVKLRLVEPFSGMLAAPNALLIVGGVATVRFAEAVLPVPPLVEATLPVVFVYWPEAAPVTVTLNWHWLFTAMVAPVRLMPVGAVVVSVPPQTVATALATVRPVGSVSVKATPVSGSTFAAGFVIVKVNEVVAFSAILLGLNTFTIDGGASTVTLAVAVPPAPLSVEVTLLVVLVCNPAATPVTFTENVQELLAAIVPPLRLIVFVPWVAVIVPAPQEPVNPFGDEITSPAGSVSLKATPVCAVALGLVRVKLRLVEPFSGMLAAPNALAILIGPITVRLMVVVWVSVPEVPVIVMALVPVTAVLLAVSVIELVEVAGLVL
jgi:hypothetical protein